MTDYVKLAATSQRLIAKTGRIITFAKIANNVGNVLKPWEGSGAHTLTDQVSTHGVFTIGNTSIPTESRGLAFDWVDQELLRVTRHVVIVAAKDIPSLIEHKVMLDGGTTWSIIWGQLLQPGPIPLIYVFGLKE
jgi:hypothetical protein